MGPINFLCCPTSMQCFAEDARSLGVPNTMRSRGQVVLMLAFDPPLNVSADLICLPSGPLELLVRDSSKPGRNVKVDLWTARSSSDYADQHIRGTELDDEEAVRQKLLRDFEAVVLL